VVNHAIYITLNVYMYTTDLMLTKGFNIAGQKINLLICFIQEEHAI